MKKYIISVIAVAILSGTVQVAFAVPAAPIIHTLEQADGTKFQAKMWGDEWQHGWETVEGYSIVYEKTAQTWTYTVTGKNGMRVASAMIVGKDLPPSNIPKHLRPNGESRAKFLDIKVSRALQASSPPQKVVLPTGSANIPVILINFNDTSTAYISENFTTLLFGNGTNSMKDYYEEVSQGAFSISSGPSGVVGWYTAANGHDYYGQNDAGGNDRWPGSLVREAIAAADTTFNFAPYDQDGDCYVDVIDIIHQGSGEEAGGPSTDTWSHRWSLNSAYNWGYSDGGEYTTNDPCPGGGNIIVNDYVIQPEILVGSQQTMGVFAHEYGHALGLPDLYDTDGSSEGIGDWGLMGGGSWNGISRSGDSPAHFSPWSKWFLGWVTPTQVTISLINESIDQAEFNDDVYQILSNPGGPSDWTSGGTGSGEYFLVENRWKIGFDAALPAEGLLIWHIDESQGNNANDTHRLVDLEEADGNDLPIQSTDPWVNSITGFTEFTTPNSNLYDGSSSGVRVSGISSSASIMTANLLVGLPSTQKQNSLQQGESALYVIPIGLQNWNWYGYNGPTTSWAWYSDSSRNLSLNLTPPSGYSVSASVGDMVKMVVGSNNDQFLSPGYGIWVLNITETGNPTNPDFNFTSNYLGQMYSMPTKLDVTSIDMFAGSNSTPLQIEFEVDINNGAEPFTYAPYSSPTQSNFDIKIGGKEVQALAVIELSQDRYKLTVLPPTQSSEGKYDLSVNFTFERFRVASSAYVFLDDVVEYGTGTGATNIDIALVIDSSGSMTSTDPTDLRKTAAKYFVDFLKNGDAAAVVDFDSNVVTWAHLIEIQSQSDKDTLKAAIDNIDSSGMTAIGYGLQAGYDELNTVVIQNASEVQQVVESPHPYPNNYDNTWIINPPHNTSRFLTLPFKDSDIKIQQGWVYTFDPDAHKGIDYINGSIDQSSTWQSFDVVAAADGVAMWSEQYSNGCGYGKFVLIRHNEKDSAGNNYFTLYAHLDSVAAGIVSKPKGDTNYSSWTPINRGEVIGQAGATGVCGPDGISQPTWIHLHFEVQRGGYAQNKTDPYDLYKTRDFYPGGVNYTNSGPNHLWTTDPPSYTLTEAKYIRVHFVNMSTESGYDYVYIRNENDTIIATYNGYYTDVWSPWVEGDTIKVQLTSDGSITYYGFYIDKYEYATQESYGANRKAAILLTDGYQNTGTHPNDVVPLYKAKGWPIYTIALTGDADEDLLKNIASETGGKFEKAETADALTEIYNELKRVVKKQSTIQSLSGAISQNQSIASSVNVDSSVQSFDISVSWPGSDLDLFLYYPNGSPVGLNASSQTGTNDPNITYTSAATYEIYTVTNPMPGNWTYNITAVQVTGNESFTASVAASTTTMLTMGTDKAVYHKNEPIIISATFMNSSGGIEGANVTATVTQPSSYAETVELSDTGSGTYKATYANASSAGSYSITVEAINNGITRVSSTDVDVNTSTAGINATPSTTGFGSAYPGDSVSLSITIADIVGGTGGGTLSLAFEHFLKELEEEEMKTGAQSVESKTMKSLAVQALQSGQTSAVINVGDLVGTNGTIGASNVAVSQSVITLASGQSVNVTMTLNVPYDAEEGNYSGTIQVISSKGNVLVHANVSIDTLTGDAVITQISGDLASWYDAATSAEKAYYIERTADKLLIWFYSP